MSLLLSLLLLLLPSSEYNYTVFNVAITKSSTEKIADVVATLRRAITFGEWYPYYPYYFHDVNITSVKVSLLGMNALLAFFCSLNFSIQKITEQAKSHYWASIIFYMRWVRICPNVTKMTQERIKFVKALLEVLLAPYILFSS